MMKRFLLSLTILCIGVLLFAQAPQSFKYQTVVRDAADEILDNQQVYFRISILQYSDVGTAVYEETFDRTTNDFGLVTFNIGEGTDKTGVFEDIDWGDGPYYVKVEVDIDGPGGTYTYEETGTSELLSVPYALHSQTTEDLGEEMDYIEEFLYSGGLLKDYDGNVYNTVLIGEQVWMAENLRVTNYADGTPIPMVTDAATWGTLTMEDRAYTFLNNDPGNADPWGAFYTWSTVTNGVSSNTNPSNVQGVCPDGWHVPSDAEWQELEVYLGMSPADTSLTGPSRGTDEGGKLKATGYDYFLSSNTGATNETGFTGVAAGNRTFSDPGFDNHKKYGIYWTSRKGTGDDAKTRVLYYNYATIGRNDNENRSGFSCRCVKDDIDETSYGSINMSSPDNDLSGKGIVTEGTIDANDTGFGAALYMASDGNYEEAAADAAATMPCVALALERGTGSRRIMLQGFLSNDDWTWTPGGLIYVSPTIPGALTQTIPTTSGNQVQIVGYATSANTIYFDPNLMLIEIK